MTSHPEIIHSKMLLGAELTFQHLDVGNGKRGKTGSNSNPTDIELSSFEVASTAASGSVVASISGTDPDRQDRLTFSLIEDAGGAFAISGGDQLVVANPLLLSGLVGECTIAIRVTDKAGATYDESFSLSVITSAGTGNVDEPPASTGILLSSSSIEENSLAGSHVANLSLSDVGDTSDVGFVLLEDAGGRFALVGSTLVVARSDALDFEAAEAHTIVVAAVDQSGASVQTSFQISVIDLDEEAAFPVAPSYLYSGLLTGDADDASARWNSGSPLGSPATVTFAFLEAVPSYYGAGAAERKDFQPFSAEQREVALSALSLVESFTSLSFVEVSQDQAQIVFGTADLPSGSGWAYLPWAGSSLAGDVWIDNGVARDYSPGADGYKTILHEIGHALGLVHPHEGLPLPSAEDNRKFTVMSYSEHPQSAGIEPRTYMPYDLAALQYLYGSGGEVADDLWSIGAAESFVGTIWDAGGQDTLDASSAASPVKLDLTPGAYSSVGTHYGWYPATDNIALAFESVIEAAIGGSGNDVLLGNAAANRLDGGRGDDTLTGGQGGDTYVFRLDWGRDVVTDFEDGVDLLDFTVAGLAFADLSAVQTDAGVLLSNGTGSVLLVDFALDLFDDLDLAPFAVA